MVLPLSEPSANNTYLCDLKTFPHQSTLRHSLYRNHLKRLFDVSLVVMSLPIVVPFMAFLIGAVALGGGNPFYSQLRIGKNGEHFRIWKLRTMVADADDLLERYLDQNSAARDEWNETQKLKSDPRITSVGRLLRKSSMDELPQLWNVLIGSMSLVGPPTPARVVSPTGAFFGGIS